MKQLPVVLVLCLFLATTCPAQRTDADQPATKADIERYYDAVHVRDMMKTTMDAVAKQVRQITYEQLRKTPNLPPNAEEQINKMIDQTLKKAPIDDLLAAMEPVYAKHFTKGDIDAMISFYSTPTGKKALTEMPAITQEAMQASSGVIRKFMDQTMEEVQGQIVQMQKNNPSYSNRTASTN
jgi:uncharacterized protein